MSIANVLADLTPEERLLLACSVLGKDISTYAHLDRGRQAMTGGNLLRNAIKKDESVLERAKGEAVRLIGTRPRDMGTTPKKENSEKRKGPSPAGDHVRSQERNWGKREQPEWVFDEKEMARLEAIHLEDEKLRAEGKLPPRRLLVVATKDTYIYFGGDPTPRYQCTKKLPKGRLTIG